MRRALTVIGDERFNPKPGTVGSGQVEPGIDVAARRHRHTKVTAERCAVAQPVLKAVV